MGKYSFELSDDSAMVLKLFGGGVALIFLLNGMPQLIDALVLPSEEASKAAKVAPASRRAAEEQFGTNFVLVGEEAYGDQDPLLRFFFKRWDQDTLQGRIELGRGLIQLYRALRLEIPRLYDDIRKLIAWMNQRRSPTSQTAPLQDTYPSAEDPEWKELVAWWKREGSILVLPPMWNELTGLAMEFDRLAPPLKHKLQISEQERMRLQEIICKVGNEGVGFRFEPQLPNADGTLGRFEFRSKVPESSALGMVLMLRRMKKKMAGG